MKNTRIVSTILSGEDVDKFETLLAVEENKSPSTILRNLIRKDFDKIETVDNSNLTPKE